MEVKVSVHLERLKDEKKIKKRQDKYYYSLLIKGIRKTANFKKAFKNFSLKNNELFPLGESIEQ